MRPCVPHKSHARHMHTHHITLELYCSMYGDRQPPVQIILQQYVCVSIKLYTYVVRLHYDHNT